MVQVHKKQLDEGDTPLSDETKKMVWVVKRRERDGNLKGGV